MRPIDVDGSLARLKEVEELLNFPTVRGHVERACKLALGLARSAPNPAVANLAMELMTEIDKQQLGRANRLGEVLSKLRGALQDSRPG